MFLRFLTLGMHAFTAHPFTICSLSAVRSDNVKAGGKLLTFYVRSRGGITGRLAKAAAKQPGLTVPVLLDGPYGGIHTRPLNSYDRALVIGCGIGAGFSLPFVMEWILAASRPASNNEDQKPAKRMQVLLATRDTQFIEWYEAALIDFLEANGLPLALNGVDIIVHLTFSGDVVTPVSSKSQGDVDQDEEKQASVRARGVSRLPLKILSGRPDIVATVRETTLEPGVSVGVAVCGPAAVLTAAQDEAAAAQLRILGSGASAKEVYLHSELFS